MANASPKESSPSSALPNPSRITAKKRPLNKTLNRVAQADIFQDIEITECTEVSGGSVFIKKLYFPYVVCLNQECDLEQDFNLRVSADKKLGMIHYAVAPAFSFEAFLSAKHWGEVPGMQSPPPMARSASIAKKITDNEIPRFHYLKFQDQDMPELVIDFKQFFTVSAEYLLSEMGKRVCSMEDLFREQISHRFSNYIARIGLPDPS